MAIIIRALAGGEDRADAYRVRFAVFVEEQRVPQDEELDALDDAALHFVVQDGEKVVGTARIAELERGVGKIGRVALLPEYRGKGIGRDLMWYVMAAAFRRYTTIELDAQVSVIPFYERLGFEAEGPIFLDAGIEHRRMRIHR